MTDQEFAEISRRVKAGALYEEQIVGDDAPALIVEIGRLRAALEAAKIKHQIGECRWEGNNCPVLSNSGPCDCEAGPHNAAIDAALRGTP